MGGRLSTEGSKKPYPNSAFHGSRVETGSRGHAVYLENAGGTAGKWRSDVEKAASKAQSR